ncbi:MAG: lamin tail domain-containing protein, partial [Roseibacillus sp.]|nr:lamin tail domain-containing protein [Roseibacillus sp.]
MKSLQTLLAIGLLVASSASARLYITEFMADNQATVEDEDGDSPDWIEIFNSGNEAVNLEGYFLTDAADTLTMWRFPAVELAENGFMLVFASGKDRRDPDSQLHTNFRLSRDGEYLALVNLDGSSIVAEFGTPENPIPEQFEDSSYGLMQGGGLTPTIFISPSQQVSVIIPADDSLGGDWTEQEFDDSGWQAAQMGIGYDENDTYTQEFGTNGDLGNDFNGVNTS